MSNRKPFNVNAGYVASKINALTGIANVIYVASEAGIDADQKYVTVCEAHHQMVSSSSIPNARIDMKDASQWCEACRSDTVNTCQFVLDFDCDKEENIRCNKPAFNKCLSCKQWYCGEHYDKPAKLCKPDSQMVQTRP